ncbi:MAG: DegT/DnrJ/EryC1/StrS family aminotransferase [Chloroflexota bacterium]
MEWRVPLSDLDFGPQEEEAVLRVLHSRWLTMGSVTQEFEGRFAEFLGVKYAIAVSNATVALHLACIALGFGKGDEVIVPSLSFVATANAVRYTGAHVRFADILSSQELNISPEDIERNITPQTKGIIVMHYGGYPCRMEDIESLAERHNLVIIEDAAHAPGATLKGRYLGTWGDAGCFSFFSNKNLVTGEGGMLVTNRHEVAEKVRLLRSHGMTTMTWDRHQGHAYSYDVIELGYNYRLDEIRSALGIVQLEKLEQNNLKRAQITDQYRQALNHTSLEIPFTQHKGQSAHHIFPVLLPPGSDRQAFMDNLREKGIQTSIHYPPIHTFSYYRHLYPDIRLSNTEEVAQREVTLPLYPTMSEAQINTVISAVCQ